MRLFKEVKRMRDSRINELAENLIGYSLHLQKGEKVLIENFGFERELVLALVEKAYERGAFPFVSLKDYRVNRALLMDCRAEQLDMQAQFEKSVMEQMDAYIGLRSGDNISELSDVPHENIALFEKTVGNKVHRDIRVPKTKWCVLRYPTPSMAQLANMSTEAFENFYFDVCNLDYRHMSKAMDPLVTLMNETDFVEIKGPGTDLRFSIKGIPAVKCDGRLNIPDGEVYTAPVRDSVEGVISFNTPSPYQSMTFENIEFTFENGKIIDAKANHTDRLNQILDTDDGSRFIGEFALGLNPHITTPMQDILFDEKIAGSFHFTPGQCYETASNGNDSAIHWDLINIQRPEYGGGEIYFDGKLIRKDGLFIPETLQGLNPDQLI